MKTTTAIVQHYGTTDLVGQVEGALQAAGLGEGVLTWQDLVLLDQFHLLSQVATEKLGKRLQIEPTDRVLDVGCGLGGPARQIASIFGCDVTGIDLNQPFIAVATMLTSRAGLSERVHLSHGDALHLTFEPESFDVAMTQHVAMNIAHKESLYAEIYRVLRPGGRFGIFDLTAGEVGPLHFPVPWARVPEDSFVVPAETMKAALEEAGFVETELVDVTQQALAALPSQGAAMASAAGQLALPLVMGPDFRTMVSNLGRNASEGRLRATQVIARRAA